MSSALLNAPQREAVQYLEGPCLVLAGAGSGKTRVITHKIAHLIASQRYQAEQIAAVTFTNKAAREMQERCSELVDKKALRGLTVCTFHSLGMRILRAESQAAGLKPGFSIFDSSDCFGLLQDLCGSTDKGLVYRVQGTISLWKNALIGPNEAVGLARDADSLQAARVYGSYAATLLAYQAVDFDDLIGRPVALFEAHPEILYRWQSRLRYFLVDEVQDTNACQYRLLQQLTGPRAAFTAVGDDDQAIYAWRGATLENLRQLADDYPRLKVIKLEQNYRSSTRILTAANALIAHNPKLFEKKLWSELGPGDPVQLVPLPDETEEATSVVMRISAARFERRARYADFAVLYRSNHQARVLEEALRREKIPYVLSGGQSFFEKAEIRDLCAWLRLLANQDDDPAFIRALTSPKRGVGAATLEQLGAYAAQRHVSLFAAACESAFLGRLDARRAEPIGEFTGFINRMEWRAARESAGVVLSDLIKAIGYESWIFDSEDGPAAKSKWQNVTDFMTWLSEKGEAEGKTLIELVQTIALVTLLEGRESNEDAVRLSTLHAAKGLEFPHVFVVGVEEGLLPHQGSADGKEADPARIEEERRLLYVGITRAQRTLTLSWCQKRKRGRDFEEREPSRFLKELGLESAAAAPAGPALSPADRMANLKALLARPRPASDLA